MEAPLCGPSNTRFPKKEDGIDFGQDVACRHFMQNIVEGGIN
jgi:hypothetical protein